MKGQKLLTPEEVAVRLQVETSTVKRWLRQKKMPGVKLEKSWRIAPETLEDFLKQRST